MPGFPVDGHKYGPVSDSFFHADVKIIKRVCLCVTGYENLQDLIKRFILAFSKTSN